MEMPSPATNEDAAIVILRVIESTETTTFVLPPIVTFPVSEFMEFTPFDELPPSEYGLDVSSHLSDISLLLSTEMPIK